MNDQSTNSLPELLHALRRKISQSAKESHLKHELTASQLEALWFIGSADKRSMESIASHLNIKPPSATSLIDNMEREGLVSREKDENDRRIVNVVLTTKLKKEFAKLKKQKESVFNELIAKLSPKDKKELERILLLLIHN